MRTNQIKHDMDREPFEIVFPIDLHAEAARAALNSMGKVNNIKQPRHGGTPTRVFVVTTTDRGFVHYLLLPSHEIEYMTQQMSHIDGIDLIPESTELTTDEKKAPPTYRRAVRVRMRHPEMLLRINDIERHSTRLLKAMQTDFSGERVTIQLIITRSDEVKSDTAKAAISLTQALVSGRKAFESDSKVKYSDEQTFVVAMRIAADAESDERANQLIAKVLRALQAENAGNAVYATDIKNPTWEVENATTPTDGWGLLLTTSELLAFLGWPIGDPNIEGLHQGTARRFPATEAISRTGLVFGDSDVPGRKRPVALALQDVLAGPR